MATFWLKWMVLSTRIDPNYLQGIHTLLMGLPPVSETPGLPPTVRNYPLETPGLSPTIWTQPSTIPGFIPSSWICPLKLVD